MSTENLDCIYSLPAAADLSANQGYPVVINTSGQIALAGAAVVAHGILHNFPTAGKQARFVHNGKIVKAKIGTGGVTAGARLATAATGWVLATTGQAVEAIALSAAAAGDVSAIFMRPGLGVAP